MRASARAQFAALCAKLDALSHLAYRPKPAIEEVAVKVDVPAILMEEVAPQVRMRHLCEELTAMLIG